MSVDVQIRTALLADATVASLIVNRLYPVQIPPNPTFPCVAMQRIATQRLYSNDQLSNPNWGSKGWARVQFTVFGDGASGKLQAEAVATAIRRALKTFNVGAEPESPSVLRGAPNFVTNEWESMEPETDPPKFKRILDARLFIGEEN